MSAVRIVDLVITNKIQGLFETVPLRPRSPRRQLHPAAVAAARGAATAAAGDDTKFGPARSSAPSFFPSPNLSSSLCWA